MLEPEIERLEAARARLERDVRLLDAAIPTRRGAGDRAAGLRPPGDRVVISAAEAGSPARRR